jgi:hypothetical protein
MDTLTCRYRYTLPAAPTQRQPLQRSPDEPFRGLKFAAPLRLSRSRRQGIRSGKAGQRREVDS